MEERGVEGGTVGYADESVMASMQEWTQPVPQDHTPARTHTHQKAKQRADKPTLEPENTDT